MTAPPEAGLSRAWMREVARMRQQIEDLEAALALAHGQAGESDTFAGPNSDHPLPLGMSPQVRFGGDNTLDDTFDVEMRGGELYILVNGLTTETAVIPQSNNTIRIRKLPRERRVAELQLSLLISERQEDPGEKGDRKMTETTQAPAGTALAQVAEGVLARVQDGKPFTVTELATLMARPAAKLPKDAEFPAPPSPVKFTDALRKALRALPDVFGKVAPTERRKLEGAEVRALTDEINAIDAAFTELESRREAIKELMRTHQDYQATEEGVAGERVADGVAKGHYLSAGAGKPFKTPVEGYSESWQQRYVSGKSAQRLPALKDLLAAGEITRAEYLGFTSTKRVLDEMKISEYIRRHPQRGLQVLAAITVQAPPGASLYAPKK